MITLNQHPVLESATENYYMYCRTSDTTITDPRAATDLINVIYTPNVRF